MNDLLVDISIERDGACTVRHPSRNANINVHQRSKAQVSDRDRASCELELECTWRVAIETSRKHDTRGVHGGQTAERAKGDTPVTISACAGDVCTVGTGAAGSS